MLEPDWKAAAVADLLSIIDYISDDNPDAAQALIDEIELKVSHLPAHPQLSTEWAASRGRERWSCAGTTSSSMPRVNEL